MCGICKCDDQHFGRKCECDSNNTQSNKTLAESGAGCRPENSSQVDCSGRGTCTCGICECETRPNSEEVASDSFCN